MSDAKQTVYLNQEWPKCPHCGSVNEMESEEYYTYIGDYNVCTCVACHEPFEVECVIDVYFNSRTIQEKTK